jgi:short subunit dehydrogenase-like uncharacterized protein
MPSHPKIILYGANGYSAKIILNDLLSHGIKPVLAGRNALAVINLAHNFKLPLQIFSLDDYDVVNSNLKGTHTLLNCAGPFSETAEILMDACLELRVNYLDITGEIGVFEAAWERNEKAKMAGITILPGIGFDVVTTDCISKKLKEEMPDAEFLRVGIVTMNSKISRGTLIAAINQFGKNSIIRKDGNLVPVEWGTLTRIINFGDFTREAISVQWGDVCNAFYTTGIPNIEVFFSLPLILIKLIKNSLLFRKIIGWDFIKLILKKFVSKNFSGPNEKHRSKSRIFIWGEVENKVGDKAEHVYEFGDGYSLTVKSAVEIVSRILNNETKSGTQTPALLFGSNFVDQFVIRRIK